VIGISVGVLLAFYVGVDVPMLFKIGKELKERLDITK
jgi:hypothetical protein